MRTAAILIVLGTLCSSLKAELHPSPDAREAEPPAAQSKVLIVSNPAATEAFKPDPEVVKQMVDRGITVFTKTSSVADAWRTIVSPGDIVGIKVYSLPGGLSGTRTTVVEAVIQGLIIAGIPNTNIVIWDRHALDLKTAGFLALGRKLNVRVASSMDEGYDYSAFYESPILGNLVWGDFEFGKGSDSMGRKSYVSRLVSQEITKIINITPLLNHNLAGVSGNLYSLATGSVDNFTRFEYDPIRLARAVPEIFALPWLADKVVLNITDALVCQYEGGERALLHYSVPLNELWLSKDPVALDSLSVKEIRTQRQRFMDAGPKPDQQLYAIAAFIELGTDETNRIAIQRITTAEP